jgi:LmbE family N-acetylglucosaminyl deacetylase
MKSKENILVISAHPDDEVLGVGGTIAKKAMDGHNIFVVILATGIASRYSNPNKQKDKIEVEINNLRKEAEKSASILKIKKIHFLDFPDNRLDTIPKMDITFELKEIIENVKPQIVYTHHFGDYNWDHRIAFDVSLMACRPNVGDVFPKQIYSYEVLSSTDRSFQNNLNVFAPNVFEDIKDTIELKKKALQCYKTELRKYPHPRSPEALEYLARKRGNEVGLEFAEAFQLIRKINL